MTAQKILRIGVDWLVDLSNEYVDNIERVTPSQFSEKHRYIPSSVSSISGPMNFDVNPYMREIVDCADVNSPIREVNVMKGVQITFTTGLESMLLYFIGYVSTVPVMYITADKELSFQRVENNFIPMLNHSQMSHLIKSTDAGNKRKSGKNKNFIQWEGGGYLIPFGAKNADKMRAFSILAMFKDEMDAWEDLKDGDPDSLTDARCDGYWLRRKIIRGSTPLWKGASKIEKAYKRGDQRKYHVRCLRCGFAQHLRWEGFRKDGERYGVVWELDVDGQLLEDSVRYRCCECGNDHHEFDKERLFSPDHGAEWRPTATPVDPYIRSYHLPKLYSPPGMAPWSKSVAQYLEAYDPEKRKVLDEMKFQVFYNNVLAVPFEIRGAKVTFSAVSNHRRSEYMFGTVPNGHAIKWGGGPILFLTMQVDVHGSELHVAVMGWTERFICYLVDYFQLTDDRNVEHGCEDPDSPVWEELEVIIDERIYTSDDKREYGIAISLIDANPYTSTVCDFCGRFTQDVYPIMGNKHPVRGSRIKEFNEFKTSAGHFGYSVWVDHYKERIAPVLRREWTSEMGQQTKYHFNAPIDVTDAQLKELTKEVKIKKLDPRGHPSVEWHRTGKNELWDLTVYGHAAVEIFMWHICVLLHEMEEVDTDFFWEYIKSLLTD